MGMKSTLRKEVLRIRDELAPDARMIKDGLIKERLLSLPEFCDSGTVLLYASFRSEVSTRALIEESIKAGKRVILPKVGRDRHMLDLYEIEDAEEAADIRVAVEQSGTPIGPYDVLIAAQARRRAALLVTANTREFIRVPGLQTVNWAA